MDTIIMSKNIQPSLSYNISYPVQMLILVINVAVSCRSIFCIASYFSSKFVTTLIDAKQ